jgi:hypothetical protein
VISRTERHTGRSSDWLEESVFVSLLSDFLFRTDSRFRAGTLADTHSSTQEDVTNNSTRAALPSTSGRFVLSRDSTKLVQKFWFPLLRCLQPLLLLMPVTLSFEDTQRYLLLRFRSSSLSRNPFSTRIPVRNCLDPEKTVWFCVSSSQPLNSFETQNQTAISDGFDQALSRVRAKKLKDLVKKRKACYFRRN